MKAHVQNFLWTLLLIFGVTSATGFAQVVYDIDGNEYGIVVIADTVWMTDNLRASKFSDGTDITYYDHSSGGQSDWAALTGPGRAAYYDSTDWVQYYGYLYNWWVASDAKGICPTGWRVPSDVEFETLERAAGMSESDIALISGNRGNAENVGGILRDTSQTNHPKWKVTTAVNTNALGFSWDGSGWRFAAGAYQRTDAQNEFGALWSSTEDPSEANNGRYRKTVSFFNSEFPTNVGVTRAGRHNGDKNIGMAIRCITDATVELDNSAGFRMLTAPVDGIALSTLLDQVWTQGSTGSDYPSATDERNVWTWDTGTGAWAEVTDLSSTVSEGTGVLVYVFDDNDYDQVTDTQARSLYVNGTINSGAVSPTVNSTASGFTLLGNPYNKTIDIDGVTTANTEGVYVWDPTTSDWKTRAAGSGDLTDGLIKPFQAFFLENSASGTPSMSFTEDDTSASAGSFYGKVNSEVAQTIRLELNGSGLTSSVWMRFSENGTLDSRTIGEALKLNSLNSDYARLAVVKGETLFDIAHLPVVEESFNIPLNIEATTGGSYELKATDFEIGDGYALMFNDHANEVSLPITGDFRYEFSINQPVQKSKKANPLENIAEYTLMPSAVKAKAASGYSITVSKVASVNNEDRIDVPQQLSLSQNYPNPFNPSTQISFEVPNRTRVRLAVYDMLGREVAMLINEDRAAGNYQVIFDASSLPSGVYMYRLQAGVQVLSQRMTLIK